MKWRDGMSGANGGRADRDDAATESALATIDEALEADRVNAIDPEDRRLQELTLALREEPPRPSPDFALRLKRQVAAGFPREPRTPLGRLAGRLGSVPRPPLPALGAALSVLVVLVTVGVFVAQEPGVSGEDTTQGTAAPDPEGAAAGGAPAAGADQLAPLRREGGDRAFEGAGGAVVPTPRNRVANEDSAAIDRDSRRVERAARMTLAAPADELQDVAAGITGVADRHDGVLLQSALTTGEAGAASGRFELRLPVDELPSALADLSDLATVGSLTQTADDQTARFVTRDDEVDDAEARLSDLQEELATVATDDEREAIRAEIRRTRADIRASERALDRVRERTSFTTVSVALEQGGPEESGLGAAVDDALGLLEDVAAGAIRALGLLLPVAAIVAVIALAGRRLRRHRRESALA